MSLSTNQAESPGLPALSGRQFRLWEDMLENRTGVRIATQREDYVRLQIAKRMLEGGWVDADSYFREVLETLAGPREWGVLLDRLLVKETLFFRHQPSHDYVRKRIAQLAAGNHPLPFNLWSAGCASGEEAYSLAVDVSEGLAIAGQADNYYIVGTDVSGGAIATAREGVYPEGYLDNVPVILKQKYFSNISAQHLKITASVKERVAFFAGNLLEKPLQYVNQMDLIFCQNVLVYFKQWRRRDIVNFFQDCLKPGGCLIIGPGELTGWEPENMERLDIPGIQAYEKRHKR
jgi:type IV pilus assembly protein PilK